MRSRRRPFASALAALAGMLFLQAAIAFAPCELPDRAAATAVAAAMADMPGCHEADMAEFGLAHCAGEEPALVSAPTDLPDLALPPVKPAASFAQPYPAPAQRPQVHLAAAGPPPRILFHAFLL